MVPLAGVVCLVITHQSRFSDPYGRRGGIWRCIFLEFTPAPLLNSIVCNVIFGPIYLAAVNNYCV